MADEIDVGQDAIEALHAATPEIDMGQDAIEHLTQDASTEIDVGQDCIEYLYSDQAIPARSIVSQLAVSVWWLSGAAAPANPTIDCPVFQGSGPAFNRTQGSTSSFKVQGGTARFNRIQGVC